MADPKMRLKAWLQIAAVVLGFFAALTLSRYLWSIGGHTAAVAPLSLYTGVVTLYSTYVRHRRKV